MTRRLRDLLVLTLACWLLVVPAAHAYIDAGSTSVIFQAVVAGLAASWMFVKVFWQRIRRFFRSDDETAGAAPESPAPDAGTEVR